MIDLRQAGPGRRAEALALNAAVAEMTSHLDAAGLDALLAEAAAAPALEAPDGRLAAFLIAFRPGAAYASPNYRWFCGRLGDFLYIDRVAVADRARGQGLARRLYAAATQAAAGAPLVCEVNSRPPNPGSDAFHAALGFEEMGRAAVSPSKSVRYLIRR